MTESFNVNVGVRQDDEFSVILFNLVLHYIVKKFDIRGNMLTKMVQSNAYVDDVIIISRKLKVLEETLQELDHIAQEIGLIISLKKYKIYGNK
jgi:Reverse transcriptase (RNA-dependent DNA polymerase).